MLEIGKETQAPLRNILKNRAWMLFQRTGFDISHAWAYSLAENSLIEASGAQALGLKQKIELEGGLVKEIPSSYQAYPTGFDLQVHLRFPGQSDRETLAGGLYSALAGGYDSVVSMPNTSPFLDNPEILRSSIAGADAKILELGLPISVFFTAAGTKQMQGDDPCDIAALAAAGAIAITDDGWGVRSKTAMAKIFELCAASGISHSCNTRKPRAIMAAPPKVRFRKNLPCRPIRVQRNLR